MTAPRPSLFARVNLLTTAVGLSLATTIALIVLLVHAIRSTPSEDELIEDLLMQEMEQMKSLPPPARIVTISVLPNERIIYNGAELTLEELARRAGAEGWNELTQVNFVTSSEIDGKRIDPVMDLLRQKGISQIRFPAFEYSTPTTRTLQSAPRDQR